MIYNVVYRDGLNKQFVRQYGSNKHKSLEVEDT